LGKRACDKDFFLVAKKNIDAKWSGEAGRLMAALFEIAKSRDGAIIFLDEVEGMLMERGKSSNDGGSGADICTAFLTEMSALERAHDVLVIAATNRPELIDGAGRRRFTERIYVPLPDFEARLFLIKNLAAKDAFAFNLTEKDYKIVATNLEGFSCDDIRLYMKDCSDIVLCQCNEAEDAGETPPPEIVTLEHVLMPNRKSSVSCQDIHKAELWAEEFGTGDWISPHAIKNRPTSPKSGIFSSPSTKVRLPAAPVASPLPAPAQKKSSKKITAKKTTAKKTIPKSKKVTATSKKKKDTIATPEQVDIIQAWHDATCERNETELTNVGQKPNHHCTQNKVAKDSFERYRAANHPEFPKYLSKTKLYAFLDGKYGKAYERSGHKMWYKHLVLNE
jgi:hypothetical protein